MELFELRFNFNLLLDFSFGQITVFSRVVGLINRLVAQTLS